MRKDKEHIFLLRKEGKSYREIQKETGVSRGTLEKWFKDIEWSKHLAKRNKVKLADGARERMQRMNMVRKLKLQYQYALVESDAEKEYAHYKNEPLFWAGLMVYAQSGDKRSKYQIRINSSEFHIHNIFIRFMEKYGGINRSRIKFGLLLYSDQNDSECKSAWANAITIAVENFYKTQVIKGKEPIRRLQFGSGMTIIPSTALKKRLLKWLELAQKETFENAVIV